MRFMTKRAIARKQQDAYEDGWTEGYYVSLKDSRTGYTGPTPNPDYLKYTDEL